MTDERLLIERAQQGEMDAFRELVERSKMNVFRLAYDLTGNRHDAEDLSQDAFIKAYRSLKNFRGDAKWSTWLYRITVNTCLDQRKVKSRSHMTYKDDLDSETEHTAYADRHRTIGPDRAAEGSLIQQHIERALERLPSRERTVFVMRHYHDLPLKQIAAALDIAEGTVKSFLFRAVQHLQKELAHFRNDLGLENEL